MKYDTIGYRDFNLSELQEILKVPKSFKILIDLKKKFSSKQRKI